MIVVNTKKNIKHKKERSKQINKRTRNKRSKRNKKSKRSNKRSKKSNKYKGGAGYDTNFLRCYDKNIEKIIMAIAQKSGKHSIDMIKAEEFISAQISPTIRQAARDLIDNTIYITLEETSEIVERLIINLYTENNLNQYDKIYLYTGPINKSSYFLSILALFYIMQNGYKVPTHFVESFDDDIFDEIGDNPIIYMDDSSYSGSQLSTMINDIYTSRVKVNKVPNFYFLLIALNSFSLLKLSLISTSKTSTAYINSPFKLLYLPERLYEPLIYKLGIKRYIYLISIFSTFTTTNYLPNVSLYFDHKVADEVSTFTKTLLYGQIIPNYFYEKLKCINEFELFWFRSEILLIVDDVYKEKAQALINDYNKHDNTTGKIMHGFKTIVNYLFNELSNESPDKPGESYMQFCPFINTCNNNTLLLQNIADPEIINFDYFLFIIPDKCLETPGDCSAGSDYLSYLQHCTPLFVNEQKQQELYDNAVRISSKINNYRCPITWYKSGEFAMTCIN